MQVLLQKVEPQTHKKEVFQQLVKCQNSTKSGLKLISNEKLGLGAKLNYTVQSPITLKLFSARINTHYCHSGSSRVGRVWLFVQHQQPTHLQARNWCSELRWTKTQWTVWRKLQYWDSNASKVHIKVVRHPSGYALCEPLWCQMFSIRSPRAGR